VYESYTLIIIINMEKDQIFIGFVVVIFFILFYCLNYHNQYQENYAVDNMYNPDDINNSYKYNQSKLLSKNYYEIDEVCPELYFIYENIDIIRKEVESVRFNEWIQWPEKDLYDSSNNEILDKNLFMNQQNKSIWNIYPFTAFGVVVKDNCQICPNLWRFLERLPGLKVALLSRLGPGTKLKSHQGWGKHSNNVIRCHFGFDVPYGCYLSVRDSLEDTEEIRLQKQNEWILFDDSRHHYAHNPTNKERIVLIVDIERPDTIKKGTSDVEDTKELLQIVDYFRQTNKL
jgi:aspartyl/asparaginyl beta-hydroxylase (cupin superfamily)